MWPINTVVLLDDWSFLPLYKTNCTWDIQADSVRWKEFYPLCVEDGCWAHMAFVASVPDCSITQRDSLRSWVYTLIPSHSLV